MFKLCCPDQTSRASPLRAQQAPPFITCRPLGQGWRAGGTEVEQHFRLYDHSLPGRPSAHLATGTAQTHSGPCIWGTKSTGSTGRAHTGNGDVGGGRSHESVSWLREKALYTHIHTYTHIRTHTPSHPMVSSPLASEVPLPKSCYWHRPL